MYVFSLIDDIFIRIFYRYLEYMTPDDMKWESHIVLIINVGPILVNSHKV